MTTIRFWGAAGTVTGSRSLVRAHGAEMLVDCGLFQGFKQLRLRNWAPFPFEPRTLASVCLTHAHIDHGGALPLLVRAGFAGRIHCSEATYELAKVLLPDAAWLQEEQAEHANRHGWSKHKPALPLYTRDDARKALARFWPIDDGKPFAPAPGIEARFQAAGHILGASSIRLAIGGRETVFSGDLGRADDPVMRPPQPLQRADTVVLESTYGNREHPRDDPQATLGRLVTMVASRGGTVVIPCFAVGRAQALLLMLARLRQAGAIPTALSVHLDSPMATDVTELYLRFREQHRLTDGDVAGIGHIARIAVTPADSRALDGNPWPKVILAGSGMATGGRVLHHLQRYAPDPRSMILFAGFQAMGTRGDALVHGAREIRVFGHPLRVLAEVYSMDMLSAHADWRGLVDWLRPLRTPPSRIFITHGEPLAADALRRHIEDELGWESHVPEHGEEVAVA